MWFPKVKPFRNPKRISKRVVDIADKKGSPPDANFRSPTRHAMALFFYIGFKL